MEQVGNESEKGWKRQLFFNKLREGLLAAIRALSSVNAVTLVAVLLPEHRADW